MRSNSMQLIGKQQYKLCLCDINHFVGYGALSYHVCEKAVSKRAWPESDSSFDESETVVVLVQWSELYLSSHHDLARGLVPARSRSWYKGVGS